jgi:hypothetical protein
MSIAQSNKKRKAKPLAVMETVICNICGEINSREETLEFDGKNLCSDCLDHETIVCGKCLGRIWNSDNAGDYDTRLCQGCYNSHYTRCGDCGIVIRSDSAYRSENNINEPYCCYCYNRPHENAAIHNYSYKPTPIFYGDTSVNRFFGVELEIDDGGRDADNAHHILQAANRTAYHVYIKTDGSLHNGFEIVTHPMTLDYHTHEMDWERLTQKALRIGYKSHKTSTCGFHIHINRSTFSDDTAIQDLCISRILFIIERFWQEFLRFSRRTNEQVNSWARRYGFKHEPADILTAAKGSSGCDRHTCLNLNNEKTIEFRIFKGTLKSNTIIATLQLVNHICDMAFSMANADVTELSWVDFAERIDKNCYPELIVYMKERRLYINEVILTEEDN